MDSTHFSGKRPLLSRYMQMAQAVMLVFGFIFSHYIASYPAYADDPKTKSAVDSAVEAEARTILRAYHRWSKKLREYPRLEKETKTEISEYGDLLLRWKYKKEYPNLTDKEIELLRERTIIHWLGVSKFFLKKNWCELYKKWRVGKDAIFKNTKNWKDAWGLLDRLYKAECVKSVKKSGQQAMNLRGCPESVQKLKDSAERYTFELVGNGERTDQCLLVAVDNTTGAVGSAMIDTVCSSTKLHKPPPPAFDGAAAGLTYSMANGNPRHIAIVKAANRLMSAGTLQDVKLPNPENSIAQETIWKMEGAKTPKTGDDVTRNGISKNLTQKVERKLGHSADEAEQKAIERNVDAIFSAINLCEKEAAKIEDEEPQPKLADAQPESAARAPDQDSLPKDMDPSTAVPGTLSDKSNGSDNSDAVVGGPSTPENTYCIDPFITFVPSDPRYQNMMVIKQSSLSVQNDGQLYFTTRFGTGSPNKTTGKKGGKKPGKKPKKVKSYIPYYDKKTKKWGYRSSDGTVKIRPTFDEAGHFKNFVAIVRVGKSYVLINTLGKPISENFDGMGTIADGLIPVMRRKKVGTDLVETWGFISATDGHLVVPFQYEKAKSFSNGYAMVKGPLGWGLIDKNGREVIAPRFERVYQPAKGVVLVKKNGKIGLVDSKTDKYIVAPSYDEAQPFQHGRAVIKKDGKYGLIDQAGKEILKPEYDYIESFRIRAGGTATSIIEKKGKRQFIDVNGTVIGSP